MKVVQVDPKKKAKTEGAVKWVDLWCDWRRIGWGPLKMEGV